MFPGVTPGHAAIHVLILQEKKQKIVSSALKKTHLSAKESMLKHDVEYRCGFFAMMVRLNDE